MAEEDIITRTLAKKAGFFADVFNTFVFDGNRTINPTELKDLDTTLSTVMRKRLEEILPISELSTDEQTEFKKLLDKICDSAPDKKNTPFWAIAFSKIRDVLKTSVVKEDGNNIYCIWGIENQTAVDVTMVTRMLVYDALILDLQAQGHLQVEGRKHKKYSDSNKLIPVCSVVIYWGDEDWGGEKKLSEMINPEYLRLFGNSYNLSYRVQIINARKMIEKFDKMTDEDLKAIASYFYNDEEAMRNFPTVSEEVANVYGQFTGKRIDDEFIEGGKVNMQKYLVGYNDIKTERDDLIECLINEWKTESITKNKDIFDVINSKSLPDNIKKKCVDRIKNNLVH